MADLYSEGPIYSEIGYSKGPKSTYYGLNDQQLPASVLNVPQTDADDEWGRTERIFDERTLDFIAKIYKTLFDPYGTLCGIILEPGTEGSEINVAKNMVRLIGRAGLEDGVFDLDVPSLTLDNIILNGSEDKIYIGSTSEWTTDSFKLADNLELYSSSSDEARIRFKSANYLRFYNNDSADPYTEIIVNGKAYRFTENTLTIPSGGIISASSLTISGDLITGNIFPLSDKTYDIGSLSLAYNYVYGNRGQFDLYLATATLTALASGELQIFTTTYIDVWNATDIIFKFDTTNHITYKNIFPSTTDTYDLGSSSLKYQDIYAVNVRSDYVLSSNLGASGSDTTICGDSITLFDSDADKTLYFKDNVFRPSTDEHVDLGTSSLKFNRIYAARGDFDNIVTSNWFSGPAFGNSTDNVTVCGGNYVSLKSDDAGFSVRIDSEGFRPNSVGTVPLGSSSRPFKELWLYDSTTFTAIRVHVCGGILQPT